MSSDQHHQYTFSVKFDYQLRRKPIRSDSPGQSYHENTRDHISDVLLEAGYDYPLDPASCNNKTEIPSNQCLLEVAHDDVDTSVSMRIPVPGISSEEAEAALRRMLDGISAPGSIECTETASVPLYEYHVSIMGSVDIKATDQKHAVSLAMNSISQESIYPNSEGMNFHDVSPDLFDDPEADPAKADPAKADPVGKEGSAPSPEMTP